jgi:hypothetical protein
MMRQLLLIGVCLAAASVMVSGAGGESVTTCSGTFAGTVADLAVAANGYCDLEGATITHDLSVGQNAILIASDTTIGHDLNASKPSSILTGFSTIAPLSGGSVRVGHDLIVSGSNAPQFAGLALCDTVVGHDLRVTGTVLTGVLVVGDTSQDFCSYSPSPADRVGHDLIVSNNFAYEFIDVGNNTVGHELVVAGNTTNSLGNYIDVSDNIIGHDATCATNTPPPSKDDPADGPNHTRHNNTCP